MLSIQTLRERTEDVRRALQQRHTEAPLDRILELDAYRRALLQDVEAMRAERNTASKANSFRVNGTSSDPTQTVCARTSMSTRHEHTPFDARVAGT